MQSRLLPLVMLGGLLLFGGCASKPVPRADYEPRYEPSNVSSRPRIPVNIRRVIVLPIFYGPDSYDTFVWELDQLFQGELARTGVFEVVPVTRDRMESLYGFSQVESVDLLPENFIERLREVFDADAVMMTDLTVNQQYRPLSLGIRSKLVDLRTGRLFWALDSVFDSSDPAVAAAARDFAGRATYNPHPFDTSGSILQSPRRFADFVAWCVLRTLPPRT